MYPKLLLARSCKVFTKNAFLVRFKKHDAKTLKEMRKCCKNAAKKLQDLLSNSPILQDMKFHENFAKVILIAGIFARVLQKLFL